MEVKPGFPKKNADKMLKMIEGAKEDGAQIIVFPEMAIPGYMIGDMWERESFLRDCVSQGDRIKESAEGIVVIFGNVDVDWKLKNEDGRVRKYNACFVAENGLFNTNTNYDFTTKKTLMPEYREFEDNRHFYSYRKLIQDERTDNSDGYAPYKLGNGLRVGCILCEDAWDTDYTISPIKILAPKSDIIVNISCSPFTAGKNSKRNRVFQDKSIRYNIPMVYVNCVGIQDNGKTIYSFDGESCIYDSSGLQLNIGKPFVELAETIEINTNCCFGDSVEFKDDIGKIYEAVKYTTKKFMERFGIDKVVVGASGGIDSALVAVIMSEILPPRNILLVNMPSKFNSDLTKNAASQLAKNLSCKYAVTQIEKSVNLTNEQIDANNIFDYSSKDGVYKNNPPGLTSFMMENVQARDRSSRILSAWAAWFGGVFTCNANKSEMTVGYTTMYGDLGGFLAPIADLWKTQVYEMAKWFNVNVKNVIPEESINVVPSAELSDKQDVTKGKGDPLNYAYHDLLFSSWVERWNRVTPEDILSWTLAGFGTLEKELGWFNKASIMYLFDYDEKKFVDDLERWWNCYQGLAVAKRIQAPPVVAVSRRAFGFDHREAQVGITYTERYIELKNKLIG